MKGLIIYKGKYGATKQYAEWLSEDTSFPCVSAERLNIAGVKDFDTIIIGTSVYIGKLQISKWLWQNWNLIKDKKIFLFLVAGTPPDQTEKLNGYIREGIPKEIADKVAVSFLPGKLIMEELSRCDRFLLKMGSKMGTKDGAPKILVNYNNVKRENLRSLLKKLEFAVEIV